MAKAKNETMETHEDAKEALETLERMIQDRLHEVKGRQSDMHALLYYRSLLRTIHYYVGDN